MIFDILISGFYIVLLVFLILLTILTFKVIIRMKKNNLIMEEFSELFEHSMELNDSNFGIINEEIHAYNQELCDKIDELRLQVGILSGRTNQTIHMAPQMQPQENLPYNGAKRGPKPKKNALKELIND